MGGYPPFPLSFFWHNDFPVRFFLDKIIFCNGGGTPLAGKIRFKDSSGEVTASGGEFIVGPQTVLSGPKWCRVVQISDPNSS